MLRRVCGPKREEVTGDWRNFCNDEFHNLHSSPNIFIRMIRSKRMKMVGHTAHMRKMRSV